ncbi:hypothetical protein CTRI78_v009044 [Colletotrichum trifolii]|uniref:Uncharacterized protein n=1 Tax=Colletotrichum trifolii TaxID=5466 RepID=A0A4R8QRQ7_COLTR|nr:hypothetical protein CTRI78_v009044 [Colletotrichum trifolii]
MQVKAPLPLDDDAWALLKHRLLAERAAAETKEDGIRATARTENLIGNSKVVTDAEWDDIQGPVRASMAKYADEIIRNSWKKGRRVNKENSARFAADILLHVRNRFYTDVARDTAAAVAEGRQPHIDPAEGPFTQKLTLENMKWVFDMKVKSHTERHRKELFLCNGCDSSRYYGFEGVIQHYAAKHTKSLSLGNVVSRGQWLPPARASHTLSTIYSHHQVLKAKEAMMELHGMN